MNVEALLTRIYGLIANFGLRIIIAIAILILGGILAKYFRKLVRKLLETKNTDAAITTFVSSLTYGGLWVFIIIAALSQIGIQTTSFIAVLGAAGLAIGLSLQGSLSNFAAGFLIIIFRPFKVGDLIETDGRLGIVKSISLFTTILNTPDNRKIIVPNSQITSSVIINITSEDKRRVDWTFSVAHDSDIEQIKDIIGKVISAHELALKDPVPFIRMSNINDSSMEFTARAWSKTDDYWTLYFDILERVKNEFNENNIGMPFTNYVIRK